MGMCSQASGSCERAPRFVFGAALKCLAGMKSYWILVLGLGMWAAASEVVFSYMPAFQETQFPVRPPRIHSCASMLSLPSTSMQLYIPTTHGHCTYLEEASGCPCTAP